MMPGLIRPCGDTARPCLCGDGLLDHPEPQPTIFLTSSSARSVLPAPSSCQRTLRSPSPSSHTHPALTLTQAALQMASVDPWNE